MSPHTRKLGSSLELLGLGFWQAWWMTAMCSDVLLPKGDKGLPLFDAVTWVMLITAFGYLAVIALSRKTGALIGRPRVRIATAVLAACGSLGMAAAATMPGTGGFAAIFLVSDAMFALGNALLLIMWGELWSTLATGRVVRCLFSSYLFAFLLYFTLISLPNTLSIPILAALPLVSLAILKSSFDGPKRAPASIEFEMECPPSLNLLAPIALLSVIWGIAESLYPAIATAHGAAIETSFIAAGILLGAVLLSIIVFPPAIEPVALYRTIVPSISCGLILIVLIPSSLASIGNGLIILGVYSLDMLIMLVSTDLAFRTRKPVVILFGMGIFAARLFSVAGKMAANCMLAAPGWDLAQSYGVLLMCAMAAVLAGTLMFTQSDLMKLYRTKPARTAAEPMRDRCMRIAQKCGLTQREQEVLLLLAHGRSIPYIAGELTIATGTAKHHVSNIYRKIGVYDRQSLHDVIEQGDAGRGCD
jgi:DNA-binding CsgD family transcriptional regulator